MSDEIDPEELDPELDPEPEPEPEPIVLIGWAKIKKVMMDYIMRYENHPERFQTLSITRVDGSNVTYNRFSDLLKDYRMVCEMADREELGERKVWRPIAMRKAGFNRL